MMRFYGLRFGGSREWGGVGGFFSTCHMICRPQEVDFSSGHYQNRPLHRAQFGKISCKFAAIIGIFLSQIYIKTKRLKAIIVTFFVHLLTKLKSQASLANGRLKSQAEEMIIKWMMV